MQAHLYVLTLFLGVVLAVHLGMNGEVGKVMNNPRVANALFWCIGALTAVVIGLTGWKSGALAPLKQVNPLLLAAGVMGACLVFSIAALGPQIGWGRLMVMLVAGQIITGLVLSHFGWLGSPLQKISWIQILGILIMIEGVILTQLQVGKQG